MLLLTAAVASDFLLAAGNWTHSTSLFSNYHFIPGYNEAGDWDVITGGNWTATNHSDANLVGDASIYLCPCPEPPCDADPEPPMPGFSTSVFACVDQQTLNMSHAVCTVFHAERSNVTCVTPSHAVSPRLTDAIGTVRNDDGDAPTATPSLTPFVAHLLAPADTC